MLWLIIILLAVIAILLGGGSALSLFFITIPGVILVVFLLASALPAGPILFVLLGIAALVIGGLIASVLNSPAPSGDVEHGLPTNGTRVGNSRLRLSESEELERGVHKHRDGYFIARGPRGGYSAYRTLEAARICRDEGPSAAKRICSAPDASFGETKPVISSKAARLNPRASGIRLRPFIKRAFPVLAFATLTGILVYVNVTRSSLSSVSTPIPVSTNSGGTLSVGGADVERSRTKEGNDNLSPNMAHPEKWNDPDYTPNKADIDAAAAATAAAVGDPQKKSEFKAALCAFYENCR